MPALTKTWMGIICMYIIYFIHFYLLDSFFFMGYIMIIMTLIKNYLFMKLVETLREKNTVPFDASVADRNAG